MGGVPAFLPDSFEWPAVWEEGAVADAHGRTLVPLLPVARIQVYDETWTFQRGWFVNAAGGWFKLQLTPAGDIEAHTAREHKVFVFDPAGRLLREGASTEYERIPESGLPRATRASPLFWPLGSPGLAWLVGAVGGIGMAVLNQSIARRARREEKPGGESG